MSDREQIAAATGAAATTARVPGHTHQWLGERLYPGGWHHLLDQTAGDEFWIRVCRCGHKQEVFTKPEEARS